MMLGNASHLLGELWAGYSLSTNHEPGLATKRAACEFGGIILCALSVELDLKFLAYLKSGTYRLVHDLWHLYDDLDDDTKNIIKTVEERISTEASASSVADILKENRHAFVYFRYPSLPMTGPSWSALSKAHNVLLTTIDDPDFRNLCPERTHD